MARDADVQIKISLIDKTSRQLDKISSSTKRMSASMKKAGRSMTKNISLPLIGIGVAGIKMASDLDSALRDIQSITGRTDEEIKQLSKTMLDMSTDMELGAFSAEQFTRSLFDVESAGFSGAEALEILAISSRSATAGQGDLTSAVNTTLSVLKAYNLNASETGRINDELAAGVRLGKQTFDALSTGVRNTAAIFSAFEIPVTDAISALTLFANKGVDAATAATRMNAAVFELNKPSAELTELINAAGFATGRTMLATLGFVGTMEALNRVSKENNVILSDTFLGRQAAAAVITLTGNNMQELIDIQGELKNSTGEMGRSFDEQAKAFNFQFQKMTASLQEVLIIIGQQLIPMIMPVIEQIKSWANAFSELDEGTQKIIVGIGAVVAIGGPLLIIVGSLIGAIGTIAGGFAALAGALGLTATASVPAAAGMAAVSTASAPVTVPLGLIAAAVLAIVAAFTALIAFVPEIRGFFTGIFNLIKSIAGGIAKFFGGIVKGVAGIFGFDTGKKIGTNFSEGMAAGVQTGAQAAGQAAVGVLGQVAEATVQTANFMANTLSRAAGAGGPENLRGIPLGGTGSRTRFRSIAPTFKKFKGETIPAARGGGGSGIGALEIKRIENALKSPDISKKGLKQIFDALGGDKIAGASGGSLLDRIFQAVQRGFISASESGRLRSKIKEQLGDDAAKKKISFGGGGGGLQPSFADAGGGDINITIEELIVPAGTPQEAVEFIWEELASRLKRVGVTGGGIVLR